MRLLAFVMDMNDGKCRVYRQVSGEVPGLLTRKLNLYKISTRHLTVLITM
jgi:hypothetical protein